MLSYVLPFADPFIFYFFFYYSLAHVGAKLFLHPSLSLLALCYHFIRFTITHSMVCQKEYFLATFFPNTLLFLLDFYMKMNLNRYAMHESNVFLMVIMIITCFANNIWYTCSFRPLTTIPLLQSAAKVAKIDAKYK